MALAIQAGFLDQLQRQRELSEDAFARACGVTMERLDQLKRGAAPTMVEFATIQLGFNRGKSGIPMVTASDHDTKDDVK